MKTRPATIITTITTLGTLIGCLSLPNLIEIYCIKRGFINLLMDKVDIPFWCLLLLIFLLLVASALAIGQSLTRQNSKNNKSTPQQDEQIIKDYMLRIKGILGNGCSYSENQIIQKLKLHIFNERQYTNFQRAISRLVEEGLISSGNTKGTYRLTTFNDPIYQRQD